MFSNAYFVELMEIEWTELDWNGPRQFVDPTNQLMMLPTDISLMQDSKFKSIVAMYASDKNTFFDDFAAAFGKLLELGVNFQPAE
eukprot:CAMPEP_0184651706 /NCGR_PEP_ID=MMETSP0308-20130426/9357_1 /TAXON_ID=38269 /ORGANISM="Gloeochaete witrockiana, Strain SAG 46.84" /LENGTH=84 /DNA_ID=CAMNT_0027086119 /DNA_START=439 /DNA_END=693 /DNA_ORIENTATION=-